MKKTLLHLLHLSDPALPIGGFSHSNGLETYVQKKVVKDENSAFEFVQQMLQENIRYNDASYLSFAFDAIKENDWERIIYLDQHCNATKLPAEIRKASQTLGLRLLKIFKDLDSPNNGAILYQKIQEKSCFGHYCIVFGILAEGLQLTKEEALNGFYYNAANAFITNCVKLIPLGQQTGQQLLFKSMPLIEQLVEETPHIKEAQLGLCSIGFDVRSMQHENLYSRLYMS